MIISLCLLSVLSISILYNGTRCVIDHLLPHLTPILPIPVQVKLQHVVGQQLAPADCALEYVTSKYARVHIGRGCDQLSAFPGHT